MSHDRGCFCGLESYEYQDCIREDCVKRPVSISSEDVTEYPDDNPKTAIGVKKPGFDAIPPVALIELGAAMNDGKVKYGLMNYREKKVSASVYYNAMLRHLFSWYDGEDRAHDSGVHHLGHIMACCAILLDAESLRMLNDDRPMKGVFADEIRRRIEAN